MIEVWRERFFKMTAQLSKPKPPAPPVIVVTKVGSNDIVLTWNAVK